MRTEYAKFCDERFSLKYCFQPLNLINCLTAKISWLALKPKAVVLSLLRLSLA